MRYEQARKRVVENVHSRRIDDFVGRYRVGQPTIVVLPGGMGSKLTRSKKKHRDNSSTPPTRFNPVWVDLGMVFDGDALKLEMQRNGRDKGNHIIVSDGPLQFLVSQYDGTEEYFRDKGWNYIVFGFDWRQRIWTSASHLRWFLRRLRGQVLARRAEDPLPTTTLLGHSMGGLVATAFLQALARSSDQSLLPDKVITVGTSFYGTSNHIERYYKGVSPLNGFHTTKRVAEISSSFPGTFLLMYLDEKTYARDKNALAGGAFPLVGYPMRDADDPAQPADPYSSSQLHRYPPWVQDHAKYLSWGRKDRFALTSELPASFIARMFHLRSGNKSMPVAQSWKNIDGSEYDPDFTRSPVSTLSAGEGDGTVPAWSARLAQTPLQQVYDLAQAEEHGDLMEHSETLQVVERTVRQGTLPRRVSGPHQKLGSPKASSAKTKRFLADAATRSMARNDMRCADLQIWRRLLEETSLC